MVQTAGSMNDAQGKGFFQRKPGSKGKGKGKGKTKGWRKKDEGDLAEDVSCAPGCKSTSSPSRDSLGQEVEDRLRVDKISFFVNNVRHQLRVGNGIDPELTLLEYLRQKGLTGTKLACGEGGCGACTVVCTRRNHKGDLVNIPVNACLATICEFQGAHVTTVEGLCSKDASTLHPIPKAMSDSHGSQCGYCTPGIVMSMYGLWLNSKEPTVRDIEEHFDGNLCRCTGYRPILQAFQQFASDHSELKEGQRVYGDSPLVKEPCTSKAKGCCGHTIPASVGEASVKLGEDLELQLGKTVESLEGPRGIFVPGSHLGDTCDWFQPTHLRDVLLVMATKANVRLQVGNTERRIEKFFKWNHKYPMTLISLSHVEEMQGVQCSNGEVRIGASAPLQDISHTFEGLISSHGESNPAVQVLQAYRAIIRWFAGHQIRSVAGLGGNIATASPISDLNPCHVAAGARLEVAYLDDDNKVVTRTIMMGDLKAPFFSGYRKTGLRAGEVIVALTLPLTRPNHSEFFEAFKQARRRDDDLAIVNAAMRVRFEDSKVADACFAFGGMAPFTKGCLALATWWHGREWSHSNFTESLEKLAEDLPLPDGAPGGMCEYRRLLARSFYFKFWTSVAYRLGGSKIPPAPLMDCDMSTLHHTTSANYEKPPTKGLQHYARDQTSLLQPVSSPDKHMAGDMQVIGRAKYLDDLSPVLDEVFLDFVLSTKAHARILRIDASPARAVEGFVDIITASDIKGEKILGPIAHDEEVIASEEVLHVGHIVACVCATSKYAARVAAKAVIVEYEDLPAIVGLEEAVAKESFFQLMFQNPGDVESEIHTVRDPASNEPAAGSLDSLLGELASNPDVAIVEGEVFMGGQEHFYLETNATRVTPSENGEFSVLTSCQNLHETQLLVSKALGVPMSKVTAHVRRLGGGFGGKESRPCLLAVTAAVAAQKLQVPVRFQMDRDVDQAVSGQRHSFLGKYKLAIHRESCKFIAADVQLFSNGGHSLDLSQPILQRAMFHLTNACHVPSVRVRGRICRTNIPSNTAFRGFGAPQGMFVGQTMYEHAARVLGASVEEVLGKNLYMAGGRTYYNHDLKPKDMPLLRMWEQMMSQADFETRKKNVEDFNSRNRYRKRGLAAVPTVFGISFTATHLNQAGALVHVQKDGTVLVSHGGVEMGQGLHTKIARVAAAALNIPIEAVYVKETNTDLVTNTSATAASSGTDLNGAAVQDACDQLAERLKPFLEKQAHLLEGPEDRRQEALANAANGAFFSRINLTAQGYWRTPVTGVNWTQKGVNEFQGDPFWYYTYGVSCSEVEVDCLTGDVCTLRSDICHDVGRSLNAAIDIGQVEGAFTQGMGLFMMEEVVFDKRGHLSSKGPGMYKIPGFGDVPLDLRVRLLDKHEGPAVMGSKAVGEPPLFLGSSIFFATKEAVLAARRDFRTEAIQLGSDASALPPDGYFRLDAPATAEKVRMACLDFLNPSGSMTPWHARA
mmetsp:Transcript_81483/g.154700  ORF Transcript_81483/g.154700 Transcript_81483/m.154700 type:complete len:1475 (+) Transcript_81483:114-4538(+)